jgi:hypothetical protein
MSLIRLRRCGGVAPGRAAGGSRRLAVAAPALAALAVAVPAGAGSQWVVAEGGLCGQGCCRDPTRGALCRLGASPGAGSALRAAMRPDGSAAGRASCRVGSAAQALPFVRAGDHGRGHWLDTPDPSGRHRLPELAEQPSQRANAGELEPAHPRRAAASRRRLRAQPCDARGFSAGRPRGEGKRCRSRVRCPTAWRARDPLPYPVTMPLPISGFSRLDDRLRLRLREAVTGPESLAQCEVHPCGTLRHACAEPPALNCLR